MRCCQASAVTPRDPAAYTWTARLAPTDARTFDDFGCAVAISEDGNTVVVGALGQSGRFNRSGAVYVFERASGKWMQTAELFSPTPSNNSDFGSWGLAIANGIVAAGDIGGPLNGFTPVVDLFQRVNGTWTATSSVGVPDDFSFFPQSIAMTADLLVVGNSGTDVSVGGSVYVFTLDHGMATQQAVLVPDDADFGTQFGIAVAVDQDVVVVGASSASGANLFSGAAYVFTKHDDAWMQTSKLAASDSASLDAFGACVAISGGTIAIGAPSHATNAGVVAGAAYVYQGDDHGWMQTAEVSASDGVDGGNFDGGVAVKNGVLAVGALGQHPQIDNGQGYPGGEGYVYTLD